MAEVDIDMATTRVIFGADVVPGMTLVVRCEGPVCRIEGATHGRGCAYGHHLLTVLTRHPESTTAITVDENGNQQGWTGSRSAPSRVLIGEPADVSREDMEATSGGDIRQDI